MARPRPPGGLGRGPQESAEELSAFLAGTCPAFYLVPDLLICTFELPLAGDAVDRDRLAALGRERLESERAARSGPVAPELRRIWEEILGCPAGDEESFFDLGGTSLRLARLLEGVDELYGGGPPILLIRIRLAEVVPAKRSELRVRQS